MASEKKNPEEGYDNPFFRSHEKEYDGGVKHTISPVASIFSQDYLRKDKSNVMEDCLTSRAHGATRVISKQTGKKGK